jgi:Na+-translocating ferredoxin:NAD+ oxidoreductase RnfC subunit
MEKDFINAINSAGIVGAGGAGFPTHVKLNAKVEYVIVNGAECEPLLRVDQQLLAIKAKEVLEALNIIVAKTAAQKGIIALKTKYKPAILKLREEIKKYDKLEIFTLGNFYPAGDEQIVVYEVLGRIVPEGGIPLDVNTIVINVETLLNVYNALEGRPVTEKYLTVTGEVKNPKTIKVPIGIKIAQAIELAGGTTVSKFKVIDGGPMMGKIIEDIQTSVTKTTKGLIVLPYDHPLLISKDRNIERMMKLAKTACMHCSLCTEVCPRNLLGHRIHPHKLIRLASYNSTCEKESSAMEAFLCCECRLCEYACVMDLQPWKLHKLLKAKMSEMGVKNLNHRKPEKVHPFREYKRYPVGKLVAKLGLTNYDVDAPIEEKVNMEFSNITLPLRQHIGISANPIVKIGDKVKKGQLIADIPEKKLGAKVHASIDGIVENVSDSQIVICRA